MTGSQANDPYFDAVRNKQRRMKARRIAGIAVCVLTVIGGCVSIWFMALAWCLPEFATLASLTTDQERPTVARKLLEAGAYPWGGKIYDARGQEIIFFLQLGGGGANPGGGILRERDERIKTLRANHSVIEVQFRLRDQGPLPQ
jgi:hypothetical protein